MFTEHTYTDGFGEIMVHQDTETDKYLRVYTYTRDLPNLAWLWDKEEWRFINEGRKVKERAFTFKTELSINPCFTNFLIKTSESIERLLSVLESEGYCNLN